MKKTLWVAAFALMAGAMLLPIGPASAASALVAATDSAPAMMNPHGDDSDANLQYMANFFDGLLQRKGADGTLVPALAERWERLDANS